MKVFFKNYALLTMFALLFGLGHAIAARRTYYVSTAGTNSNPGTISQPFLTLQKAANVLVAGDTVYVRGGTYKELLTISTLGTSSENVVFRNYPNENPIIDGEYLRPNGNVASTDLISGNTSDDYPLVMLRGSYITFDGFEITRSAGVGVTITNYSNNALCNNNKLVNCKIYDCRDKGVWIYNTVNANIRNNDVYRTANFASYDRSGNPDWPSCLGSYGCTGLIVYGNIVHENWGEGIGIWNDTNSLVENNTIYDSMSGNLYLDNSVNTTINGNLIYNTKDPRFSTSGNGSDGINIADEASIVTRGSDITMINNVIYGCQNSIRWRNFQTNSGLKNVLIANNSFVNPFDGRPIDFESGNHNNVKIINNIVKQDNTSYKLINISGSLSSFTLSNNQWSRTPELAYTNSSDVIGDPNLAQTGSTAQGQLGKDWFKLNAGSIAIDKGMTLPEVSTDMFGNARVEPIDLGADEYQAVVLPITLLSLTATPMQNGTLLKWFIPNNINVFEILRSTDGATFTSIGSVKPPYGDNSNQSSYSFTDNAPINEAYYRLKQIDKNGKEELSKIIHVNSSFSTNQISVYPNPASDSFTISTPYNTSVVTITSTSGALIKALTINTKSITVSSKNWAPGTYMIQVKSGNNSNLSKLLIVR